MKPAVLRMAARAAAAKRAERLFQIEPIGIIHSPFRIAAGTPIQPGAARSAAGTVIIRPALVPALKDLDGFERIWLIYRFHRARFDRSKLTVIPFLDEVPHGVFATRAPSRPNAIGLSAVRLISVRRNELLIADVDILDGTPLLDIKPYVPQFDAFATARCGWLQDRNLGGNTADQRFTPSRAFHRRAHRAHGDC